MLILLKASTFYSPVQMHSEKATSIFGIQAGVPHSSPEMTGRCWAETGQVIPQRWMKTCSSTGCLGRSFSAQNSACSWQGAGIQGRVTQWGTPIGCGHLECPRKISCICCFVWRNLSWSHLEGVQKSSQENWKNWMWRCHHTDKSGLMGQRRRERAVPGALSWV